MPHKSCDKVMSAIFAEPWAITPDSLEMIIGIANRTIADRDLALSIRESRAGGEAEARKTRCAAIISILGPIFPHAQAFNYVSGATSIDHLTAQLRYALADRDIDHIILNIDSPGGQVTGVHEFARLVRTSCAIKPITAYVSGYAASAAYWIACAADRIVADRTAKVGSIGVITAWTDDSAVRKAQGLRDYVIVSSQSPKKYVDPKSPAGKREIQEQLDAMADIFIGEVAEYRGVAASVVAEKFGQGAVFLADPALELGMVDEIAVLDTVLTGGPAARQNHLHMEGTAMTVLAGNPVAAAGNKPKATKPEDEDEAEQAAAALNEEEDEEEDDPEASDDSEPEEDEDDAPSGKAKQNRALKAKAPEVWQAAFAAGIRQERARIQGIRELGLVGHKKLVEKAMFTSPMSAEKLAVVCAKADRVAREGMGKARIEETAGINVASVALPPGNATSTAAEEQAAIAAMAGGIRPIDG